MTCGWGKVGAPKAGAPKAGAPKAGAPKAGAPKAGAPKAGAPKAGAPKAGAPKAGAPKGGAPKGGAPKGGAPKGPEGWGPEGWGPEGWGPEGWGPEGWGAQNFALFFPCPAAKFVLFFPLWGFSRGILVVFEAPGRLNVHVWSSWAVVCEPQRPGLWQKLKERQRVLSKFVTTHHQKLSELWSLCFRLSLCLGLSLSDSTESHMYPNNKKS